MKRTGRQRPGQQGAVTRWSRAAGLGVLVSLATGQVMLLVAAAIFVLVVVLAAVIAGAAFASSSETRESAARTLDLLLRAVPGYRPPPPHSRRPHRKPDLGCLEVALSGRHLGQWPNRSWLTCPEAMMPPGT